MDILTFLSQGGRIVRERKGRRTITIAYTRTEDGIRYGATVHKRENTRDQWNRKSNNQIAIDRFNSDPVNVEDIDGMAFYRNDLLPGYAAIFREADGDLNFCCYIMPGGPSGPDDLREMHDWFLRDHPVAADFVADDRDHFRAEL